MNSEVVPIVVNRVQMSMRNNVRPQSIAHPEIESVQQELRAKFRFEMLKKYNPTQGTMLQSLGFTALLPGGGRGTRLWEDPIISEITNSSDYKSQMMSKKKLETYWGGFLLFFKNLLLIQEVR